jgi:hypothetical protein
VRRAVHAGDDGAGPKGLTLAIADYLDGERESRPEEIDLYLNTRDWGDPYGGGWMRWPAQLMVRLRWTRNVYNAWRDYTRSDNRVKWLNEHPGGAEIVSLVKSYRYEEESEMSRLERWESWNQ